MRPPARACGCASSAAATSPADLHALATSRANGYRKGVPMGGDLPARPTGKAPAFLVYALRDPDGANLDRIQIIKGWLDADGKPQEKVYDVAWSGDRKPGADGKLPPVGKRSNCRRRDLHQHHRRAVLDGVWKDPDFDPAQRAFYYVRVIEIPTPRWTAYDAKFFGRRRCPKTCR